MPNLGYVSSFNINGNELSLKDAALTEIVNEIIEAIGANNGDISERINNLHDRAFDALIKISSQNESEISNIQDGMYKLQYVTITGEGEEATETLNNSAILIQKGTNQYLYKDGQLSSRTKTDSTWGNWVTFEGGVTSVNGMTGAVTVKENVQADWNATTGDAAILNKPNIENTTHPSGGTGIKINGVRDEYINLDGEIEISNGAANITFGYNAGDDNQITLTSRGMDGGIHVITDNPFTYNNKEVATVDQIITPPVTSVNGMTGAVTVDVPVTSVNGATGAVITQLSDDYAPSSEVNENLELAAGDTYEEAFGKLHKAILDNEQVVAGTLADFDERLDTVEDDINNLATVATSGDYDDLIGKPTIPENVSDLNNDLGFITQAPVTSVNGMTGAVVIPEGGVTSFNGATGAVTYTAPVTSVNGMTGAVTITIPEGQLSNNYATATGTNSDLLLASGDTYEQAFGKLEKEILDNELIAAAGMNDLNDQIANIIHPVSSVNGMTGAVVLNIPVTSVNGMTGAVTITETQLSKGTATGTGNAVTDINVSNHQITLVKGAIYTTQEDVNQSIAALVDSAPETLNTLNELAEALGNDENFATTVATQIGEKYTKPSTGIPASDLAAGVIPDVPVQSVNGMTGAVTLALGDANVIETIKVNNTALTPVSKAVNITVPTKVSDLTNDSNFTSNTGTITGITMNGVSKGTSGVVNLGTVLTEHQDISGKVDKVTGMGLSSNDYTTTEKNKLAGINIGSLDNLTTAELNSIFASS